MLDDDKVLSIVQNELHNSYGEFDTSNPALVEPLDYYLGNPNGRETEGHSRVTSTDVADAIEWIMPQIMESFTQNNDIVTFDAVHQGDEKQAELESQYVYEVLMKQNDGFILLHQFIKDALMQRNGILKVFYENDIKTWHSNYTGIGKNELSVLGNYSDAEIVEMSEYPDEVANIAQEQQFEAIMQQYQMAVAQGQQLPPPMPPEPIMLYDVKVKFTSEKGRVVIEPVAPEEFRLTADHNSINVDTAKFSAHVVNKSLSDLREMGVSDEVISRLPIEDDNDVDTEYRFTAQGESVDYSGDTVDESMQEVTVVECYLLMDYNEDGIAELCKVTTVGRYTPSELISVEEIEEMPWVTTTCILMSHKFQGLSIYDRLKEIQDQKTTLWRNMFDNLYLQNNQRYAVLDGQVNLDDMLISRPGGIVKVKRMDAIQPLITPQLSSDSYQMMGYLDEVKAGRSGVSAEGGATPQNIGDRVGSQGVDRMMNAKEALVGLIIRVIAETGIKPLCIKIRNLSQRHIDSIEDFRFRGEWQKIQPSSWNDRTQCTVRVGTGSGDRSNQIGSMIQLMEAQARLQDLPGQVLAGQQQMYNLLDSYCKFSGLNGASNFFVDPSSQEGQQKTKQSEQEQQQEQMKQDQMNMEMVKSQTQLANAELQKAQAQQQNVQMKAQNDDMKNQLTFQDQSFKAQMDSMQAELDQAKLLVDTAGKTSEMAFKYDEMDIKYAIEMAKLEAQTKKEENENVVQNKEDISNE
jgi:hypothetical protein